MFQVERRHVRRGSARSEESMLPLPFSPRAVWIVLQKSCVWEQAFRRSRWEASVRSADQCAAGCTEMVWHA